MQPAPDGHRSALWRGLRSRLAQACRRRTATRASSARSLNDDRADWREAWALFPGDVAYVWHGGLHASDGAAERSRRRASTIRSQIIWDKDRLVLRPRRLSLAARALLVCGARRADGHWTGDRKQTTVWPIPRREDDEHGHGTQKPVECMKRPIENNSSPGQAVYEPFCGSGTTIIAAEMTGRSCHAIELDPGLCRCRRHALAGLHRAEAKLDDRRSPSPRSRPSGGLKEPPDGPAGPPARSRRSAGRSRPWPPMASRRPTSRAWSRIDPKTLRKHYRDELDLGETKANAQVAGFCSTRPRTATSPRRSSG